MGFLPQRGLGGWYLMNSRAHVKVCCGKSPVRISNPSSRRPGTERRTIPSNCVAVEPMLFCKLRLVVDIPEAGEAFGPAWRSRLESCGSLDLVRNECFEKTWPHDHTSCLNMTNASNNRLPHMLLWQSRTGRNPTNPKLQRSNKDVNGVFLCRKEK